MEKDRYKKEEIENFLDKLLTKKGLQGLSTNKSTFIIENFLISDNEHNDTFRIEDLKTRIIKDYLKKPDEFVSKPNKKINSKNPSKLLNSSVIDSIIDDYQSLFLEFYPEIGKVCTHQNIKELLVIDEIFYTLKEVLIGRPILDLANLKNSIMGACRYISERKWLDPEQRMDYLSKLDFSDVDLKDFFSVFGTHLKYIDDYKSDFSRIKNVFYLINETIADFPNKINLNNAFWLIECSFEGNAKEVIKDEVVEKSKIEIYSRKYDFVKNLIEKINNIQKADSFELACFFGVNYEIVSSILSPIQNNELKSAYSASRQLAIERMKEYNNAEVEKVKLTLKQMSSLRELEQIINSTNLNLNDNYQKYGKENAQEIRNRCILLFDEKRSKLKSDELKIVELEEIKAKTGYYLKRIYDFEIGLQENILKEKEVVSRLHQLETLLRYAKSCDNEKYKSDINDYVNAVFDMTKMCTDEICSEENRLNSEILTFKSKRFYEGIRYNGNERIKQLKTRLKIIKDTKKQHEYDKKYIADTISKVIDS